jgi:hypothetical protein
VEYVANTTTGRLINNSVKVNTTHTEVEVTVAQFMPRHRLPENPPYISVTEGFSFLEVYCLFSPCVPHFHHALCLRFNRP